jgi:predicted small lipoprotein YifL
MLILMNTSFRSRVPLAPLTNPWAGARRWAPINLAVLVLVWTLTGCGTDSPLFSARTDDQPKETQRKEEPAKQPEQTEPAEDKSVYKLPPIPDGVKRKEIAPDLFFETEGEKRRVVVIATVCLRDRKFLLEGLLTKKGTKEHEYLLSVDTEGEKIHALLIAARAKPGSPVSFDPKYSPACGTPIKLTIRYLKDGKLVSIPAQQWIRDAKTKKNLSQDWVFGGSRFEPDINEPAKPYYLANQGDFVCVANMESAMLDLPVPSARGLENRSFESHTERIPPLDTRVELIFEPVLEKK